MHWFYRFNRQIGQSIGMGNDIRQLTFYREMDTLFPEHLCQRSFPMSDDALDLAPIESILDAFKQEKGAVIPILQQVQEIYGYLPKEALAAISKKAGIPITRLYGVATFYAQFRLTRRGRHLVKVCDGTACHVRGATKIVAGLEEALNVSPPVAAIRTTSTAWKSFIAWVPAGWRRLLWWTTKYMERPMLTVWSNRSSNCHRGKRNHNDSLGQS
jgi:hypothetical protein